MLWIWLYENSKTSKVGCFAVLFKVDLKMAEYTVGKQP